MKLITQIINNFTIMYRIMTDKTLTYSRGYRVDMKNSKNGLTQEEINRIGLYLAMRENGFDKIELELD
jgi:hypothetical protein